MNIFKRLFAVVLVLTMVVAFAGCADTQPTDPSTTGSKPTGEVPPTTSSKPEAGPAVTYRVKVQDPDGNPIEGVMIQLCLESCFMSRSNAEGYAEFTEDLAPVAEGYKVNVFSASGYEYDKTILFYFDEGKTEMVITLEPVAAEE